MADLESLESDIDCVYMERLKRLKSLRSAKLGALTRKINEIRQLMENVCNVELVKSKRESEFTQLHKLMEQSNDSVQALMSTEEEKEMDQDEWYKPKAAALEEFNQEVLNWIADAPVSNVVQTKLKGHTSVAPRDSISNVKSVHSQSSRRSSRSSITYAKIKLESRNAELLARAARLTQKQALEREEAGLKERKEQLELETDIAANTAKLNVIKGMEDSHAGMNQAGDRMNEYVDHSLFVSTALEQENAHLNANKHTPNINKTANAVNSETQFIPQRPESSTSSSTSSSKGEGNMNNLISIMEKQTIITETMIKQQKLSSLPPLSIPTINGNPLDYRSFIRAFEHGIEEKTEISKDRLYFLEQCTIGQPRELVRSCQYMQSDKGYTEAKRLLKHHYGDEYLIATAYIDKALNWPSIKPEDPQALKIFAVFLNGCLNTMDSVEYMEEMDHPINMRAFLSKLPYKLRENWRAKACNIQDINNRRVTFEDLVKFVNHHARILSHPVFGNLKEIPNTSAKTSYTFVPATPSARFKPRSPELYKSGFATSVSPLPQKENCNRHSDIAQSNRCIYCKGEHHLSACNQILKNTHKEKLEFLGSKGLCFGCLEKGHMSKGCKQRHTCKECNLTHPTLLHFSNIESSKGKVKTVANALVDMDKDDSREEDIGAGEPEGTLAIVPVKVKTKQGNTMITTYAFLDPGSTATFCTESILQQLQVTGRNTEILLRTMNKEESVETSVACDLEICGLESNQYVALPPVYSQNKIPVRKANIPSQEDVGQWEYLKEVNITQIDAEVGLP